MLPTNPVPLIRQQIRLLVDPLLLRLREELYGSGASYGLIAQQKLPSTVVVTGGGGGGSGGTNLDDYDFISGLTTLSGAVLLGTDQKELEFRNLGVTISGERTIITAPILSSGSYYTRDESDALFALLSHTHTHGAITDWNAAVAATPSVSANTAAIAAHTPTIASATTLGHIKIGTGLIIDGAGVTATVFSGVLSVGSSVIANPTHFDFREGFDITAVSNGARVALNSDLHPGGPATTTTLGHVIIGENLSVDTNGVISAAAASGMQNPMTSTGDMIFRSALNPADRLAIGSDGQVLMVSGGLPVWETIVVGSGGGDGGAPTNASYVTLDSNAGLSDEAVLGSAVLMTGTYGALPAASKAGKIYLPTDTQYVMRDTGLAWEAWGPVFKFVIPPETGWSWVNQSTASVVSAGVHRLSGGISQTGYAARARNLVASSNYTVIMCLRLELSTNTSLYGGVGWRQSSNGRWHITYLQGTTFFSQSWASPTSFDGSIAVSVASTVMAASSLLWFRLKDDGTNRSVSISRDGVTWTQLYSGARTTYLTPDQVGFLVGTGATATVPATVDVLSYVES